MPQEKITILPRGTKVPDHIAIVLDGNRRWARSRGLHPSEGHKQGYLAVMKLAKAARDWGVHTLTAWALSTENWQERPESEQRIIMALAKKALNEIHKDAKKEGVRFIHIGRRDRLPKDLVKMLVQVEEETKHFTRHILNLALDYGGQDEIVRACQKIVIDKVDPEKINEKLFASYLDTADQPYPYPDLFIRPAGEQRTSGLLIFQSAYCEFYFEEEPLPSFTPEKLKKAILDYSRRRRRFGGNDAVEHFSFEPEVVAKLELAWWRLANIPEGTAFIDYAIKHLREQFGMSAVLARKAARYMVESLREGDERKWDRALLNAKRFYKLIKDEVKLAFEPKIVASLQIKLWKDLQDKDSIEKVGFAEETARELYAETYRISLFQAAKLAHLRVLAKVERNLASSGAGEHHWDKAEDYLQKFYSALKDRVA